MSRVILIDGKNADYCGVGDVNLPPGIQLGESFIIHGHSPFPGTPSPDDKDYPANAAEADVYCRVLEIIHSSDGNDHSQILAERIGSEEEYIRSAGLRGGITLGGDFTKKLKRADAPSFTTVYPGAPAKVVVQKGK
jgi:hypothetical protein